MSKDPHPWDDLNILEVLFGLFLVGCAFGLLLMITSVFRFF